MKKVVNLTLIVLAVLIVSVSFASANVFSDVWGKITGKVTTTTPPALRLSGPASWQVYYTWQTVWIGVYSTDYSGQSVECFYSATSDVPLTTSNKMISSVTGSYIDGSFKEQINQVQVSGLKYGTNQFWIKCRNTDGAIADLTLSFEAVQCYSLGDMRTCSAGQTCSTEGRCQTSTSSCTNECSIGQKTCYGPYYYKECTVDSNNCNTWSLSIKSCPADQTCSAGVCSATPASCTNDCTTGQKQCSGNGYQTCGQFDTDSCLDWSTVTSCSATQTCSAGACSTSCTNDCTTGQKQCSGNGYQTCGNYDSDSCLDWSTVTACSATQTCSAGVCSATPASCTNDCTTGQKQCSGNGYQTCGNYDSDSCLDWSTVTSCTSSQTCLAGACSSCTPLTSCSSTTA